MTSRLNLHTKLSFDPMIFSGYQKYMPRDSLQRLYLMNLKPDKTESKSSFMAWRAARKSRARPFDKMIFQSLIFMPYQAYTPRLKLDTKLSFDPRVFRQYQMCTPRDDLQRLICAFERVVPEKQRIQRHVGHVEPGYVDFRPYQAYMQRDSLQKLICAFERVGSKKQWIQTQFGDRARSAMSGLKTLILEQYDAYLPKLLFRRFPLAPEHIRKIRHVGLKKFLYEVTI